MDLDAYRLSAETFISELTAEYYRHYAGLQDRYEIEPIYARHAELFRRGAVDSLRALARRSAGYGEEGRRLRMLVDFAVEGYVGQATKATEAELAWREAALSLELDGTTVGFRESAVLQANEPDADRRARIEEARLAAAFRELDGLYRELIERQHACARELGWASYEAMCVECKGVDFGALCSQTEAFRLASETRYADVVDPELRRTVGLGLDELRRSDLSRFFRAQDQDGAFPADRLVESFVATMQGLGVDVRSQSGVILDVDPRTNKSPRAFCAPVKAPGEVYLVLTPMGGRDDYAALFHEGGHTEHYAHVDPGLAFEFRYLGDNAVTEAYAFLFQHLVEDPEWLSCHLGVEQADQVLAHARAQRLIYLRRYGAKLAYEVELHGDGVRPLEGLAGRYADLLSRAVGVQWPAQTFLADVDPGFYCACYLRAWALETHLRGYLRERFGRRWFQEPEAGGVLRSLWREGQRLGPEEVLAQCCGEQELDFRVLLEDLAL